MEVQQVAASYKIGGCVYTDFSGIQIINNLYSFASKYNNCDIYVDFSELRFMDANLFALFNACVYRLNKEKKVRLRTNFDHLSRKFDIFFKNGAIRDKQYEFVDSNGTTIPFAIFYGSQQDEFYQYVQSKLLPNNGFNPIPENIKVNIQAGLSEIHQNIRHAQTEDPLFICGQHFPTKKELKLTLVDLGCGYLEPIRKFTSGAISTDIEAIRWALTGYNSIDLAEFKGGMGLKVIRNYCSGSGGTFQICSGTGFWDSYQERGNFKPNYVIDSSFKGTITNIIFKTN
ncbi:hypothetical protein SAMN04488128_1011147 [Chitinophaga eiseniae]|uniref:STAS domain-containing protein n=1 Tax=Chitinophaga eiseniae TaxID=634771 RepID=A0A1T4ML20_9BACT|nr:hypothetical protein [Chitinophaga eiseniae]SJZ67557.1 hypothetical protein SAMN04488128_1011147 [Chitinophaga eiseniae]